jgi:hypothetical protein
MVKKSGFRNQLVQVMASSEGIEEAFMLERARLSMILQQNLRRRRTQQIFFVLRSFKYSVVLQRPLFNFVVPEHRTWDVEAAKKVRLSGNVQKVLFPDLGCALHWYLSGGYIKYTVAAAATAAVLRSFYSELDLCARSTLTPSILDP